MVSTNVFANNYTSEIFSSQESCNTQKDKNDTLYPNFSRSECTQSKSWDFYYNICDTNYCVTSQDSSKLVENKEKELYQYDSSSMTVASSDYKLDDATSEKLKNLAEWLETRFQKMSEWDLEKWNENFIGVLDKLAERSKNNDKNLALIDGIKNQIWIVLTKQKAENDLCKNQYWIGWKEASFFFESDNMITWIEWNKKHTLACEFKEVIKKPIIIIEDKIDITKPIKDLYRATAQKYSTEQNYRYQEIDMCTQEFGTNWQISSESTIDAYKILYNTYWIETSGENKYWNWKKLITTSLGKSFHKACVKNTLGTIEDKKPEIIDVYKPKPITDEYDEESKNPVDIEIKEKEIDITEPIQGLYRATTKKYLTSESYLNTGIDKCQLEFWLDWEEAKYTYADPFIMLYNRYNIKTRTYSSKYWDWKKLIPSPANESFHTACVKNTLDAIVDDKYRITQWKYRWNILRDWDICKSEYWDDWKISKNKTAYTKSFAQHSKTYPNLLAWALYPNDGQNDCGGHHSNNSWNGTVHRVDNTSRQVNSCSYNPEKKVGSAKGNQHFVCEKETKSTADITPIVQGLYKTTVNQYSYKEAYWSDFDYCKVEYGRDWKRNTKSIDANIMLYSKYKVYTWIEWGKVWNWQKSVNSSGSSNHIACIEDIYNYVNENYKDILTSATPKEIEDYMYKLEQEILSKIRETKDFVFIDDGFAITQKRYYWNQIYTEKWVCPLWYELQKNRVIWSKKIQYNRYYAEILWKYVEKNRYKFYTKNATSDKIIIPFRTWSKWDEQYVAGNSLDTIKKESQEKVFEWYNINLWNPSKFMKNSNWVIENNNYLYHGNGSWNGSYEWPSVTVWTLLPALCVNNNIDLNSSSTSNKNIKTFKIFNKIEKKLMINDKKDAGRWPIFFAYEMAKVTWFFNYTNYNWFKNVEYFLPINTGNTLWFIKKIHY